MTNIDTTFDNIFTAKVFQQQRSLKSGVMDDL